MSPPAKDLPVISRDAGLLSTFTGPLALRNNLTAEEAIAAMEFGDVAVPVSSDWIVLDSYENLDACRAGLSRAIERVVATMKGKKFSDVTEDLYQRVLRFGAARCIATDDPRLK